MATTHADISNRDLLGLVRGSAEPPVRGGSASAVPRCYAARMLEQSARVLTRPAGLALGLMLCACKQPMAAPAAPPPAHAEQPLAAPVQADAREQDQEDQDQPPPHDPFELQDEPEDSEAVLESMRHNCCDEMPAKEIHQHVDAPASKAK